jgi:hypothetical protein
VLIDILLFIGPEMTISGAVGCEAIPQNQITLGQIKTFPFQVCEAKSCWNYSRKVHVFYRHNLS